MCAGALRFKLAATDANWLQGEQALHIFSRLWLCMSKTPEQYKIWQELYYKCARVHQKPVLEPISNLQSPKMDRGKADNTLNYFVVDCNNFSSETIL